MKFNFSKIEKNRFIFYLVTIFIVIFSFLSPIINWLQNFMSKENLIITYIKELIRQ